MPSLTRLKWVGFPDAEHKELIALLKVRADGQAAVEG